NDKFEVVVPAPPSLEAMHFQPYLIFHSPVERQVPELVRRFAREQALRIVQISRAEDVLARVNRSFPACIVVDTDAAGECIALCRTLKIDTFCAIVPVIFLMEGHS